MSRLEDIPETFQILGFQNSGDSGKRRIHYLSPEAIRPSIPFVFECDITGNQFGWMSYDFELRYFPDCSGRVEFDSVSHSFGPGNAVLIPPFTRSSVFYTDRGTQPMVDGHNPTMLVSYDATSRWAVREGEHSPRQYIDYSDTSGFSETGMSPKAALPILTNWEENLSNENGTLEVRFTADRDFAALPLVWWDRPEILAPRETARTRVIFTDVHAGENRLIIPVDRSSATPSRSKQSSPPDLAPSGMS